MLTSILFFGDESCILYYKHIVFIFPSLFPLLDDDSSQALHPDAEKYIKNFKKLREELASRLFKMFNEEIFKNQVLVQ